MNYLLKTDSKEFEVAVQAGRGVANTALSVEHWAEPRDSFSIIPFAPCLV
jgi:hypothetical protein